MNRCDHGVAFFLECKNAVTQALIVVNDVVLRLMLIKIANEPAAEGIRLWEASKHGINILDQIGYRS